MYHDYCVVEVYVPFASSFQQFVKYIQRKLFPSSNLYVSCLTVYWDIWLQQFEPHLICHSLLESLSWVVDSILVSAAESTSYLNSELPIPRVYNDFTQ